VGPTGRGKSTVFKVAGLLAPSAGAALTPPPQALGNAFYKILLWRRDATPDAIAATVPPDYWLGYKAVYATAVRANMQVYCQDGIISAESRQRLLDFLKQFDKEIAAANIDSAKTWDERFVKSSRHATPTARLGR
jgi:hypothetical protein